MSIDELLEIAKTDTSWGSSPSVTMADKDRVFLYVGSETRERKMMGLLQLVDSYQEVYLKVHYIDSGVCLFFYVFIYLRTQHSTSNIKSKIQ